MREAAQWVRSALFVAQMYAALVLFALAYAPAAIRSADGAVRGFHAYCRWVRRSAAAMVGLRSEVRGPVPRGEALIAAKHQSFFDIIILMSALPRPRFVMKAEIARIPVVGWYARRIGCIPVERGRRGAAIAAMLAELRAGRTAPGQLVIYPQGTRVAAGADLPYKAGVAAIQAQTGLPCIPAATNVGVFWPRRGLMRRPGLAVVEFLPPLAPGLPPEALLSALRDRIEGASDALMAEAGFRVPATKALQPGD